MRRKKNIVISLLGTRLDAGEGPHRWTSWRPTVSLAQQQDFELDGLELLYDAHFSDLANAVLADVSHCVPGCVTRGHPNARKVDPWDFQSVYGMLYDFARNYAFDLEKANYYVHLTTGTHVAQICLFLLTESRHFPANLIQASPPGKSDRDARQGTVEVIDLDLSKYDVIKTRFAEERAATYGQLKNGIETRNAAYNQLIADVTMVASVAKDPILLTGPTGAGKSVLAKRIFELRQQKNLVNGHFVEVNCATLRGDAAMSMLFGHVKGAFTGAVSERVGLLREANGGVLFLDEIGELGLDEQALLLRALEDKAFFPFGGDRLVKSDFQLVCGTNRDLETFVQQGNFREDLLARINLWTFAIPGLAERKEDLAPNLDYELERFEQATGKKVTFNKEAREAFLAFAKHPDATWRGNFRDFSAAITRLATLAPRGRVTADQVATESARLTQRWQKLAPQITTPGETDVLAEVFSPEQIAALDLLDQVQIATIIRTCRTSKSMAEAGRKLFAVSRLEKSTTNDSDRMKKLLSRFGLTWELVG